MIVNVKQSNVVSKQYVHNSQVFVALEEFRVFQIELVNWWARRLAVVSVDGINVIDGSDAGYAGTGYVLNPSQTLEIPGWLKSGEKAASFTTVAVEQSYAVRTGRDASNVGVIGVAVFDEKVKPVFEPPWGRTRGVMRGSGQPIGDPYEINCSTSEGGQQVNSTRGIGTGFGKEVDFRTTKTSFERATDRPACVQMIRYGTVDQLRKWGVPIDAPSPSPSAFPVESNIGYCPTPKDR
mgnify:CR=1 FL=1